MILLTRLDGEEFMLNAELIKYVESRPDTFVTLTTGERLVVRETMAEVLSRTLHYQQSKYLFPAATPANLARLDRERGTEQGTSAERMPPGN